MSHKLEKGKKRNKKKIFIKLSKLKRKKYNINLYE